MSACLCVLALVQAVKLRPRSALSGHVRQGRVGQIVESGLVGRWRWRSKLRYNLEKLALAMAMDGLLQGKAKVACGTQCLMCAKAHSYQQ